MSAVRSTENVKKKKGRRKGRAGDAAGDASDLAAREKERISALRMQMLEMHPFWGYLLLQMKLEAVPELPSFAATDCLRRIWFNPRLTQHLSESQLGFVLAHEIGHQLFLTTQRERGRNRYRWNCATDYVINRIVTGIRRPGYYSAAAGSPLYNPLSGHIKGLGEVKILLDSRFDGMLAETVYEELVEEDLAAGPVTVTISLSGTEYSDLQDHNGGIDVHLPDSLTDAQVDEIRGRLAGALEMWKELGKQGHIPGDILRSLRIGEPPRVPWHTVFRRYSGQALARDEYSLSHPNRRYLEDGIVVPGCHNEILGQVVVALDTSGSMPETVLDTVGRELAGIRNQVQEMTLIIADCKVQEVVPCDELDRFLARSQVKGGGGTDHRPVFNWIAEHHIQPDLFIGLTDLATQFPQRPPAYPVIWLVPPNHAAAPWGHVIEVNAE